MKGFFTSKQTESKSRPDGKTYSCASCGLYKDAVNPKIKPFGEFKKGIMIIGEAPGEVEDQRGKPWQGKAGRLLKKTLRDLGIDLFEDCVSINACHCRPMDESGRNRTPTNYEVDCCRKSTFQIIDDHQPKVIILLGGSAIHSMIGHRWKKELGPVSKWRGWCIPDQDLKAWVCPTFHPSYISRILGNSKSSVEVTQTIWEQDLTQAIQKVDEPFLRFKKPNIQIIEDLSPLKDIKADQIAFDYETTGLKPHAKGHRIVSAAVAYDEDNCYSFIMPMTRKGRKPFTDLLDDYKIGKMAHNMKFEETWSAVRLHHHVQGWDWDSMIAAHILDNRQGVTGLKFQTYAQFGVVDYASDVTPYLKADKKNANSINRIDELLKTPGGEKSLLEYCGMDAICEYRLAMQQIKQIDYSFLPF